MKSKGIRSVIGSRSLTVTALSNGDSCMISSPMKFQRSRVPSCAVPIENETSVEERSGGLRTAVFFPSSLWLETAARRPPLLSQYRSMGCALFPSQSENEVRQESLICLKARAKAVLRRIQGFTRIQNVAATRDPLK